MAKTFDIEFYKELFRLWKIPFIPKYIRRKPQFIGHITTKYIYEQLPYGKEIIDELKQKSEQQEDGSYKYRFHQLLTPEIGREALKKQIYGVTTLMSISNTKEEFQKLFEKKYSANFQLNIFEDFDEYIEEDKSPIKFDKNLKKALDYEEGD